MPETYWNNGGPHLVFHAKDQDALDKTNHFTGDHYCATDKTGKTLVLTLNGWDVFEQGDYLVHLFASTEAPLTLKLDTNDTYIHSGFVLVKPSIFEKFFERPHTYDQN